MKLKSFLDYKFTYLIVGALITGVVSYVFNARLIEKEYFYKAKSERQSLISDLTEILQKRIYNGEVFLWNLKSDARKTTILDSWDNYKKITLDWNEKLPNYYFKLDMYFPQSKYMVSDHSNYLKVKMSFKDFLQKEMQLQFIPIHDQLVELKIMVLRDGKPDQGLLDELDKNIIRFHAKVNNYCEALYDLMKD
jgi:hypothetical protein